MSTSKKKPNAAGSKDAGAGPNPPSEDQKTAPSNRTDTDAKDGAAPNTTDEATKGAAASIPAARASGETGGSGPDTVTEPPDESTSETDYQREAKAGAGATDNNNKGAGRGDREEPDVYPFTCVRQVRYGDNGGKLYAVGSTIWLPEDIALPLLDKGRISPE